MIAFFPQLYDDELVYSWFARYHVRSGHLTYRATAEELFANKDVTPSPEFLVPLTREVYNIVTKIIPWETLISKHTMLPYYVRFLPLERRKKAFDLLIAMDKRFYDCLYVRRHKTQLRKYMRYCPMCAAKDRNQHGETYWHRRHQLTGIDICPEHRCRLADSTVGIAAEDLRFTFAAPETTIPVNIVPNWDVSETECQVADYVLQVFEADLDLSTDVAAGSFLHSKLGGTPYVSARGQNIYAKRLFADLSTYYSEFQSNTLQEWWCVQKVFCAQNFHVLDICLIALYLAIPVEELIDMKPSDFPLHECFDRRVIHLRNMGATQAQVAKDMGVSIDIIKAIDEQKYRSTQNLN